MQIGEKIMELRKQRNWSRKDLAAALEESSQSVARWEAGTALPELDRLIHISMIFEVPLQDLLGDQAGVYDLKDQTDPGREAEKRKKDRLLLGLKIFGLLLVLLLGILVNMVWLRFLFSLKN